MPVAHRHIFFLSCLLETVQKEIQICVTIFFNIHFTLLPENWPKVNSSKYLFKVVPRSFPVDYSHL